MGATFLLWLRQIKQHPYATGIVVLSVLVFILFILSAYWFGWDWTGFNSGTSQITITSTSKVNYTATVSQPSKSLWDWFQLLGVLAIPIVVGFGAAWFTHIQQQRDKEAEQAQHAHDKQLADKQAKSEQEAAEKRADVEREIALDNQREVALQGYIDKMSELLLHEHLSESSSNLQVKSIAQARTITVLRILEPVRRGSLIRFLSQADILAMCIGDALVGIDLKGANLTKVNLDKINLEKATLQKANLWQTSLQGTNLMGANLQGAILLYANLEGAILDGANLRGNILNGANLENANLMQANLDRANLSGVNLTGAILEEANLNGVTGITIGELEKQAKTLKDAVMPDGSSHF